MKPKEMRLLGMLVVICACIFVLSILAGGRPGKPEVSLPRGGSRAELDSTNDDSLDDWLTVIHQQDQQRENTGSLEDAADQEDREEAAQQERDRSISDEVEGTEARDLGLRQKEKQTDTTEPGAGISKKPKSYVVKKGDTLSAISRNFYGTAAKWKMIFEANRELITRPEDLRPQMVLAIPELALSRRESPPGQKAPSLAASRALPPDARYYDVQKGDNLWRIAKEFYGNGTDWPKIMKANSDLLHEPEDLRTGMRLILP